MQLNATETTFRNAIDGAFRAGRPARLGIAVSGGSDSLALLYLLAGWSAASGVELAAVTVDHGLRDAAAAEAKAVADHAAGLGIAHDILHWQGHDGSGNLQDRARRARYRLMADWAARRAVDCVALGHTMDDQAETLLMRLARGAGVDGLAAMRADFRRDGVRFIRPMLAIRRPAMRDLLSGDDIAWAEDPSNDDPRYQRAALRRVLPDLAPLGLTVERLSEVTTALSQARAALELQATAAAQRIATIEAGDVRFAATAFLAEPSEIRHRLLMHALKWVASAEYGPRGPAVSALNADVKAGRSATLHGCRVLVTDDALRVTREWRAVRDVVTAPGAVWDGRWRVHGPLGRNLAVRALGEEGIAQCPAWRDSGLPRASLLASPAVWGGTGIVAAPLAGWPADWRAELIHPPDHFFATFLSH